MYHLLTFFLVGIYCTLIGYVSFFKLSLTTGSSILRYVNKMHADVSIRIQINVNLCWHLSRRSFHFFMVMISKMRIDSSH